MKKYIIWIFSILVPGSIWSQATGQLTITPANPTPTDTIYVISKLTYSGNCSYGLVYTYTSATGNTLEIMPTYCGYGSTTTCTDIDTLKIAPQAIGNYLIKVEYHQGSVCPLSGFDAVIGNANATVNVGNGVTTQLGALPGTILNFRVYPNPAKENITIELPEIIPGVGYFITVRNLLGEEVLRKKMEAYSVSLNINSLPPGIYCVELKNSSGFATKQKIVVQ